MEWELVRLGALIQHLGAGISRPFRSENIGRPVLRSNNVRDGQLVLEDVKYWYEQDPRGADLSKVSPLPGDILVNFVNGSRSELGKAALYRGELPGCIVSTNLFILRLDVEKATPEFVHRFLQTSAFQKWLYETTGFTGQGSFNQKDFANLLVPVPAAKVQEHISACLLRWESAEEILARLIAAKKRLKQCLCCRLLSGSAGISRALTKETGQDFLKWEWKRTREVFQTVSTRKANGEVVLSVTQDKGVVPRQSLDRKIRTADDNTDSYKLVEPGDFIISLRSFQGGLEYSGYRGLVSPAYHVIRPRVKLEADFYRQYFKSQEFIRRLAVAIIGIRDGKQVNYDDFSAMRIPTPPLEEQRRIADTLDAVDREIDLLTRQADALARQKKGILEKLLTGQVGVKSREVRKP